MRKATALLFCLLLLHIICVSVSAHPGATDSKGGHTNRSTGSYHYHHGYSAHQHTDQDGDGVDDCPYEFVDKTDHCSSSGSSTKATQTVPALPTLTSSPKTGSITSETAKTNQNPKEAAIVPVWYFSPFCIIILILLLIIKRMQNTAYELKKEATNLREALAQTEAKWKRKSEQQYAEQKAKFHEEYKEYKSQILTQMFQKLSVLESEYEYKLSQINDHVDTLQKDNAYLSAQLKTALHSNANQNKTGDIAADTSSVPPIPKGVYFLNGKIVTGAISSRRPFGDFTVYVTPKSNIYHSDFLCGNSFSSKPNHIYDVLPNKRPCLKCGKHYADEVPEWYHRLSKISESEYCQESFL